MDLKDENGETLTVEIPVGSLPPCRQVGITDGGYLEDSGLERDVEEVITNVYFVDPAGPEMETLCGTRTYRSSNNPRDRRWESQDLGDCADRYPTD